MSEAIIGWFSTEKANIWSVDRKTLIQIVMAVFLILFTWLVWSNIDRGVQDTTYILPVFGVLPFYAAAISFPTKQSKISIWGALLVILALFLAFYWMNQATILLPPGDDLTVTWGASVYGAIVEMVTAIFAGLMGAQAK